MYNSDARLLKVQPYISHVFLNSKKKLKERFSDDKETSALLGVQLNEPIYALDIRVPPSTPLLKTSSLKQP